MDANSEKPRSPGRFLGLPYDWRNPTRDRVRSRLWNPDDRRLFPPKAFGWGYSINAHELFRRLGLVRLARMIRRK